MNLKSLLFKISLLIVLVLLFLANSSNPPNGRTGAPGDGLCSNAGCHSSAGSFTGDITISGLPTTVTPNTTYPITVEINNFDENAVRTGFQLVALDGSNNNVGTITGGTNVVATTTANGRIYAEHSPAQNFISGTYAYSFNWTSPASGSDITMYAAGVIGNGVGSTGDVVVTTTSSGTFAAAPVTVSILSSSNVTCNGGTDGAATANASDGTSPYTFQWSNGTSSAVVTGLSAETYTVTVTDDLGGTATTSVTITEPSAISCSITNITDVSCNGGTDGSATITCSGGTGNITSVWPGGMTGNTATGLSAGVYEVISTDANGCSVATNVTINENAALTGTVNVTNETANGANDGTATAVVSGGTGTYTYAWSNAVSGATITNLSPDTYTVTITDSNACSVVYSGLISAFGCDISASITATDVSCNGENDGSATVVGTGGTLPYSYSWSNGDVAVTSYNLGAGIYTVTITDFNDCVSTAEVVISEPFALSCTITSQSNPMCFQGADGTAIINCTGGTGTYTYTWSNGGTLNNVNDLTSGTHTVTVTDAVGCQVIETVTLNNPSQIQPNVNTTDETSVGADNGTASSSPVGGTGPYTYMWNTGSSNSSISGLTPGTYSVTITDSNGCVKVGSGVVEGANCNISVSLTNISTISCHGANDASVTAVGNNGLSPYIYTWSNGFFGATANGLGSGPYAVTVIDEANCAVSTSIHIISPSAIIVTTSSIDAICPSSTTGSASVTSTGGIGAHSYQWSNGESGDNISNIAAGVYTVTVTDNNGCTMTNTATVEEPPALVFSEISSTDVLCNGGSDGTVTAVATGGTPGYSYTWSNGTTTMSNSVTGLMADTYTVTVTDANGCETTASVEVNEPEPLVITNIIASHVSCNGEADGLATALVSGGTTPYSYQWSNGTNTTDPILTGLSAGTYTLTIVDANGCISDSESVAILEPETLIIDGITATDISCNGGSDGSLTVNVSGGTAPYMYEWSDNTTTGTNGNLEVGTYTVTVTDANGCTSMPMEASIAEPDVLMVTIDAVNDEMDGDGTGSISISVSGGVTPYTYDWQSGGSSVSTDMNPSGLSAGDYAVDVTDANGCVVTSTTATIDNIVDVVDLSLATLIEVFPNPTNDKIYINWQGTSNAQISVMNITGKLILQKEIEPGNSPVDVSHISSGIYLLRIQSGNSFITKKIMID